MRFPKIVQVEQNINTQHLVDYSAKLRSELEAVGLTRSIKKDMRVAITAGSRGIAHIPEMLAIIVDEVKKAGGQPFLFPAMGSHGGATAEGQMEILSALGITETATHAPILATSETKIIGTLDNGEPVYIDKYAAEADGIIVVNRIKPNTDFKDEIESGLMKMMSVGMGKQKGSRMVFWHGREGYHKTLKEVARLILEKMPIFLGVGIVENAAGETAVIKAIPPTQIEEEEKKLLRIAKSMEPGIPLKQIHVLVIKEIGKDISGTGMDTNVVGRFWLLGEAFPELPEINRIVVLDLTDRSHGNAVGIGLADFTTRRLFKKTDLYTVYLNSLNAGSPETAKLPIVLSDDRAAIWAALNTCGPVEPESAKLVIIRNTMKLNRFHISEALIPEAEHANLKIIGEPQEMEFDLLGNFQVTS
ncbi:MAG: lactate racemase domain-containing protein [Candidatus Bathyarchaeia archaeon]